MAYEYQNVELDDFSGGETDNYIKCAINRAQYMENLYVLDNRKPVTRPGCRVDDATNTPQILTGSLRIGKLLSFKNNLFNVSESRIHFRNPTNYEALQGPSTNDAFVNESPLVDYAATRWNGILILTNSAMEKPVKIYQDDAGDFQLRTAGLPALASSPTVTPGAGVNSYIYGFAYEYTYNVGDQEFVDVGPVTLIEVTSADAPDSTTIAITTIPTLANGASGNYDTTVIKVAIFRSANGGGVLYRAGQVTNGTATFNDTMSDATLQTNAAIYTTGDVPDNDPPPQSKYCHTVGGFTLYGHLTVGAEIYPNVLRQSQIDDPDSVPESFEVELEDDITGISSVNGKPIVGCEKYIYALEGSFDELGRGGISSRRISDTAGCVSHNSFVQTDRGLFWAGNDGFYGTQDGISVFKISKHLNRRYKERLDTFRDNTHRIQGKYDADNERIYWTFSQTTWAVNAEECDIIWVCDLRWGVSEEMTFYTWSGDDTFLPSAIEVHDKELYRGDRYGFVLKFSSEYLYDDQVDGDVAAASWLTSTIMWTYRTSAQNFGSSGVRKIASHILVSAVNITPVSIAIRALNDDSKVTRDIEPIRWRRSLIWGEESFYWDDPTLVWYSTGLIETDRRFPAQGLRFNYLQIELTNAYAVVMNSTQQGQVTVAAGVGSGSCTLVDGDAAWPRAVVGYYLYLAVDNYTQGYEVIDRVSDTEITVRDTTLSLTSQTGEWVLKGYKKSEILSLNEINIKWAPISRSHDKFNKSDRGLVE